MRQRNEERRKVIVALMRPNAADGTIPSVPPHPQAADGATPNGQSELADRVMRALDVFLDPENAGAAQMYRRAIESSCQRLGMTFEEAMRMREQRREGAAPRPLLGPGKIEHTRAEATQKTSHWSGVAAALCSFFGLEFFASQEGGLFSVGFYGEGSAAKLAVSCFDSLLQQIEVEVRLAPISSRVDRREFRDAAADRLSEPWRRFQRSGARCRR
jgi:hypothetical protein